MFVLNLSKYFEKIKVQDLIPSSVLFVTLLLKQGFVVYPPFNFKSQKRWSYLTTMNEESQMLGLIR